MPSTLKFEHYEVMLRDDGSICELGRGAMGITYKGLDTRLRVPVALKVINAANLHSEKARQRFVREARSAAKLRHRNVASVFHLGQEGDDYFYAMEFIDGETVDCRIKRQGPLPLPLALHIAAQVARALNAAQAHDLVHRDIKPANLMLVNEDDEMVVKVIDFGLAKVALGEDEDAAVLTMSGFLGTPHFASPEQLEEREIDVRSDIYSLGVTLWYALTGKTPFTGSVVQVMSQHISRPPPFEDLASFPEPVAQLLRRMLEKNPADRPQTATELRREIERCLKIVDPAKVAAATAPALSGLAAAAAETAPTVSEETQFATGAAIGDRYLITEQIGASESGGIFRARDNAQQRDVRLITLDRKLLLDGEALAQFERDAEKLAAVTNPHVVQVVGLEASGLDCYLTLEWIDGFSLLELLRTRRELSLGDVMKFLPQAAEGLDAALAAKVERLDVGLPHFLVHFPECEIASEKLLRRPFVEWPEHAVKFNALTLSRDRFAVTWAGDRTIVGGAHRPADTEANEPARVIREFGAMIYELLGGVPTALAPGRYTPLASLDEAGNGVLRKALLAPKSFASAAEFARLFAAPPEIRAAPPARPASETVTPETPPTVVPPAVVEAKAGPTPPPIPPPEAIEELVEVTPPPAPIEVPVVNIEVPPVVEPMVERVVEPVPEPPQPVRPVFPEPVAAPVPVALPPARRSRAPALLAGAAVVALAGAAGIWTYLNRPEPAAGGNPPGPTPTPVPIVVAPTPVPRPPPPPPPTKMELAQKARENAEILEKNDDKAGALAAWIQMAREFPEFDTATNRLEVFIGLLRERGLSPAEFNALREPITEAARLKVLAAMLVLGEQLQKSEPATALEWYSAAAEKGDPVAMTQSALLLSNGAGGAPDPAKIVDYLARAAEKEEPNAMLALGQLYLSGRAGLKPDETRALKLLRGAADTGNAAAMTALGDYYVKRMKAPSPTNPDGLEAFRLFSQADASGSVEALRNLGVLHMMGAGTKQDEKAAAVKFKEAGEKGDANGMYYYGACIEEQQPSDAKKWFRKAADLFKPRADRGDSDSMYYYASSLEKIDRIAGSSANRTEMRKWFKDAAELGNGKAIEQCAALDIKFKRPAPK